MTVDRDDYGEPLPVPVCWSCRGGAHMDCWGCGCACCADDDEPLAITHHAQVFECSTDMAHDGSVTPYRARCSCGWRGPVKWRTTWAQYDVEKHLMDVGAA